MKLDRNINLSGKGKYAVINMRKIDSDPRTPQELAEAILAHPEAVEWGCTGSESEFWLIKLKDKFAQDALVAYAEAAASDDPEYAAEVAQLSLRSGIASPFCKRPD